MSIATVVAWLWMAAQSGNIPWDQDVCRTYEWIVEDGNGKTSVEGLPFCPIIAEGHSGPADFKWKILHKVPAEHVIEIRTRHEDAEPKYWDQAACPAGKETVWEPTNDPRFKQSICARVTREIWVDGVKWGVLKESESGQ